ncbi:NAD-dependent epimerase/dehydratase family protein [Streptococcus suis]|uniref:3-beta hydroxysteroid dehydrogenase n=1 Tax=Streptococcus suis TaxID=1307 RepID=M1VDK6_STRSU|nr:NAD-dependent epimerase/dehydratase family protein [Streptococcus suis]AGS58366.1 Cps21H [Streptococcus suis]MBY5029528.1 NAD-dependent epimerase/dehydratase family protein [Streptococcus suis]MDY7593643.1 NAD-dependent epimerase/dehydratase family protein [Streptococcus suis]NQH17196.1 NAD-dependent epimerase/dehydratase family protein [Streptococcus suis]NQH42397.1 NAD-dependent epimerase/dehydratase family protein [Streptococcus suis]
MKRVLITGANSYIGTSFEKYVLEKGIDFEIDTLDLLEPNWKDYDFSGYDSVFHVAGIAHFSKDESKKELYYKVNTELTEHVAKIAKQAGVRQFIFMSSIIVYGDSSSSERIITKDTVPSPSDFYGDSKWQAEQRLEKLVGDNFRVVILRPPMIYGKGSKGNYPKLSKVAQKTPIFPVFSNSRSMLHIDNLCEFIKQIIDLELSGLFCPQNSEYVNTSKLVEAIAEVHGKKIYFTKTFNPIIKFFFHLDTVKKVFGNLVYEKEMSRYTFEYQINNFEETIRLTEE